MSDGDDTWQHCQRINNNTKRLSQCSKPQIKFEMNQTLLKCNSKLRLSVFPLPVNFNAILLFSAWKYLPQSFVIILFFYFLVWNLGNRHVIEVRNSSWDANWESCSFCQSTDWLIDGNASTHWLTVQRLPSIYSIGGAHIEGSIWAGLNFLFFLSSILRRLQPDYLQFSSSSSCCV